MPCPTLLYVLWQITQYGEGHASLKKIFFIPYCDNKNYNGSYKTKLTFKGHITFNFDVKI